MTLLLLPLMCMTSAAPKMEANPPSTLLLPGAKSLPLEVTTDTPTTCRWAPTDVPFASMPNTFTGGGGMTHASTLTGLSGGIVPTVFYVQCAA